MSTRQTSLRARFAVVRLLIYATGGLAVGGVEISTKDWLHAEDSRNRDTGLDGWRRSPIRLPTI
jgi:hypothetical protein